MGIDLDLAKAAFEAGRLEEAEALLRAALREEPARAASDLGGLFIHMGRVEEGARFLLKALAAAPAWPTPRYNLAHALLSLGHDELGWRLLEARREIPELETPALGLPFPEWRGEPLAGRRIVVIGEQGAGDQIMFARYNALLARRGAEVAFLCLPTLAGLFPGALAGLTRDIAADVWALQMSLPDRLGPDAAIPPPAAIAVAPGSGGGVGVMARGNPEHANDRNRSLHGPAETRLLDMGRDLSPAATGAADFRDTAEIIAGLDLVISVDSAVAHLAASMGKPTWILIPGLGADWRWRRGGAETAWYPTARLYRQARPGDWDAVLEIVAADLAALDL